MCIGIYGCLGWCRDRLSVRQIYVSIGFGDSTVPADGLSSRGVLVSSRVVAKFSALLFPLSVARGPANPR